MKDTALYEQLLGLSDPWSVKQVELSIEDNRVTVEVELKRGIVWVDPEVEGARAHIHGWTERQWRHLDTCQFETIIKARVPQLKYRSGKVEELAVPWAERYARVTILMEAFVLRVLAACSSTQKVSELMKLNWHTINEIMRRGVERGLLRREEQDMPHLGIDEKSIAKGHSYASVLTDIDGSRVLDLVEGRQLAASEALLGTLSESQRAGVKAVAMDMWPAFMTAARKCLPRADVVHDRFHVSKYLNESVDAVRRAEQRQLLGAGDSPLTGSKWAWLKSYPDGRSAEALAFRSLHQMNLKTSRAWRIKESFTGSGAITTPHRHSTTLKRGRPVRCVVDKSLSKKWCECCVATCRVCSTTLAITSAMLPQRDSILRYKRSKLMLVAFAVSRTIASAFCSTVAS